ncbi:hypothetical protein AC578_788 [Pseudocercospora eumusae]|uniref:Major facilitator superfamily (MFS) profile domain-containing protein n=1 Tax=Pseudocercospora eumusae TaxID=321146 RepID=A0A139HBY7_9PEZI|nr:hypothetical protein AC578_788 [Pseudocercospora eumusae]
MLPWTALAAVAAASLAALSLGLDVGMISSTLVQPTFLSYFDKPSPSSIGGVVAAFSAGACFGALSSALISDRYGRLWGLRIGSLIAVIGAALQAGAVHVAMLIIGRLVNGFGAGILTATFPVYASEVAPPNIRGALGGFQMLMISAAIFIATATGYGFGTSFTNDAQWRGPLAVQAAPLLLLVPISFFIPETPRYLVSKDREDQAYRVLSKLHRGCSQAFIEGELTEMVDQIRAERAMFTPNWAEIFQRPSWRRRILLIAGLQIMAQLTGINCIQYYASNIYEQLGFSTFDALRLNLIYGAFGFIFNIFWVLTIDRFPRIRLIIGSLVLMCAALLTQAVLSGVYDKRSYVSPDALRAQVAMFFVFNLGFMAMGMLTWLIPPEMCPMVMRAKANALSVAVNNVAGLVVAEVAPIGLAHIGFKFFFLFVACDLVAIPILYLFYPETSKLSLEEMNVTFADEIVDHLQKVTPEYHAQRSPDAPTVSDAKKLESTVVEESVKS